MQLLRKMWATVLVTGLLGTGVAGVTSPAAAAQVTTPGTVTGISRDGHTYTISTSTDAELRVIFYDDDLFRIWLAPNGEFSDPANAEPSDPEAPDADIVVNRDYGGARSTASDHGAYHLIRTEKAALRIYKDPLRFALYEEDNATLMWREVEPLSWGDSTTQTLSRQPREQFFGGGMQNGRFAHRGDTIDTKVSYDWNEGGEPNSVPFYLSTAGYGVLRNTFAPNTYTFTEPVRTTAQERRFDAYYFVGDLKEVIDGYTELTGRPFMPPLSGLEVGDADCYLNSQNGQRRTYSWSKRIAEGYTKRGMPLGWMLVNDGYGCGYEALVKTGTMLRERGVELGLWTQEALTRQEFEVGEAGVRVRKLDVAWVGPGYRHALDACETAHQGIERHSDARGYVWQPESWAGAQRCAVAWSGDQAGSWDYIRWQIPTYAGATMSGLAYTTGDIDGIFGGSAKTYVRDLQWKMFLPVTMSISGWAEKNKQPWRYGQPYTAINKKYLRLHERLLPYFYTYSRIAHQTGVGMARPLVLEYPNDPNTWGDKVKDEFLSGEHFLVAPVYRDSSVRNDIYLPEGTWIDYWTGRTYRGPTTIDGYHAPLDRLPLFVKAGAVVPMWPKGTTDWKQGGEGELVLDIYPQGHSSFTRYMDDGHTRTWKQGEHAEQTITVDAPRSGRGNVTVTVGASDGSYAGQPDARHYLLKVHTGSRPGAVQAGRTVLDPVDSREALEDADSGWYYAADHRGGTVYVKTAEASTDSLLRVHLRGTSAVGGPHPGDERGRVTVDAPELLTPGRTSEVTATFDNRTGMPARDVRMRLDLPPGWAAEPTTDASFRTVKPGEKVTVSFEVTSRDTEPGGTEVTARAEYRIRQHSYEAVAPASVEVPYASLAAAFNNIATTTTENVDLGAFDSGGSSFSVGQLREVGVSPGSTVTHEGVEFTWPDVAPGEPDNVQARGQTIAVRGRSARLAFLGSEAGFASGTVTVHYADGSSVQRELGFPNWCCDDPNSYGAEPVITTYGKNTPDGYAYPGIPYRIFYNDIRIDPAKKVVAVTLPNAAPIHIFGIAFKPNYALTAAVPDQVVYASGGTASVPVTVTNRSTAQVGDAVVRLEPGADVRVSPEKVALPAIPSGESRVARFTLDWPVAGAHRGEPLITVSWSEDGQSRQVRQQVPLEVTCAAEPTSPEAVTFADSEETAAEDGAATNAIDGDPSTYWHTEWSQSTPGHPHEIQVDLGQRMRVCGFRYLPRQSGSSNGTVADYRIYLSSDGETWGEPVASGTFASGGDEKWVPLPQTTARYVRFVALSEINGGPWTSAAEITVDAVPAD